MKKIYTFSEFTHYKSPSKVFKTSKDKPLTKLLRFGITWTRNVIVMIFNFTRGKFSESVKINILSRKYRKSKN